LHFKIHPQALRRKIAQVEEQFANQFEHGVGCFSGIRHAARKIDPES